MRNIPPPYGILAELTHRCPLACLYCANPVELAAQEHELSSKQWLQILSQARDLGAVQLHLSGGEPLLRLDLEQIAAGAAEHKFYTNLITSGVGLSKDRARDLAKCGINNVQLSLQSDDDDLTQYISGRRCLESKLAAAEHIQQSGLPLCFNLVIHRHNIEDLDAMVKLCVLFAPHRIELAHAQYHGLALLNREHLLPTRKQVEAAGKQVEILRQKFDEIEIVYVKPDWYESLPKPCNGGWANLQMTIAPNGVVLPCPGAYTLKTLQFESALQKSLSYIWYESSSFNAYRGFDWMSEPCRSCSRKEEDFGGCRCQAFALSGEASATDPVCHLSGDRKALDQLMATL